MLGKTKKLLKSAGKYENQQKYKDIFGENMVSTPERLMDNNTMPLIMPVSVKKPSERKLVLKFSE